MNPFCWGMASLGFQGSKPQLWQTDKSEIYAQGNARSHYYSAYADHLLDKLWLGRVASIEVILAVDVTKVFSHISD